MANRSDDFNRANSSSSLGIPSDGGSAWVAVSGVWGIYGNRAYLSNGNVQSIAVLESSTANADIQVTISNLNGGQDIGLVARAENDNNYIVGTVGATGWSIYKKIAGSFTAVGTAASGTPANGDVVVLSVSGTSVALKINGVTKVSGTVSELATNTKHGIRSNGYTPESFDDFSITDLGGGGSDATAPAANVTGTGSISAPDATGGSGSTGSFTFPAGENNTHSGPMSSVAVNWAWHSGGAVGAASVITNGSGTMTSSGMAVSGLPLGAGYGVLRSTDGTVVGYREGTVS